MTATMAAMTSPVRERGWDGWGWVAGAVAWGDGASATAAGGMEAPARSSAALGTATVGWVLMSSSGDDGGGGGGMHSSRGAGFAPHRFSDGFSQSWMSSITSVQLEYRFSRSLASIRAMMVRRTLVDIGVELSDVGRFDLDDEPEQGEGAVGPERHGAGDHFEEGDTEGVDVGAVVRRLVEALLGRKIARGAHEHPGRGQAGRGGAHQGETEVGDLDQPAVGDHEVGGFDVPVDHPLGMGVLQTGRRLEDQAGGLGGRDLALGLDHPLDAGAVDILHHEVVVALILGDRVDLDDVGMAQGGGALRLPDESLDVFGVLLEVVSEQLDGDESIEGFLVGLEDDAHPTAAEFRHDLVVTDPIHVASPVNCPHMLA